MPSANCRSQRQRLHFEDLAGAIAHAKSLQNSGYEQLGNWSLGQVCNHLAQTVNLSVNGFPFRLPSPVAAVLRWAFFNVSVVPRLMGSIRLPTSRNLTQETPCDDQAGIDRLIRATERMTAPDAKLKANPLLGQLTVAQWQRFHGWHAARHLSFLRARGNETADSEHERSGANQTTETLPM